MKKSWMIIGAITFFVLITGGSCVSKYNQLVSSNESVTAAWSQVENVLQRRNDLIPNLVNTVKGYATHEQETFQNIANARAKLAGASTINEKVAASQQMDSALSRLLVVVENYPELKANQSFLGLQDELAGTENRIAVERQRYNETVKVYNLTVKQFPGNLLAKVMGFGQKDSYFKATAGATEVPKVQF